MYVDADSLGDFLRRERELQHISLQDISAATKIQLRFLQDLENDAYDQLPPAPFVVGFLRAYAQCLALDPEEIVAVYHAHYGTPDEPEGQRFVEHVQPSRPSWRFGWKHLRLSVLLMVVLIIASIWYFAGQKQAVAPVISTVPEAVDQEAKATSPMSTRTPLPVDTNAPQLQISDAGPDAVDESVSTQEPVAPLQDNVQMTVEPAVGTEGASDDGPKPQLSGLDPALTSSETASSETPSSGQVYVPGEPSSLLMLQVMALEDTWLRVEIDGEQRHTLLLVAGKSIEWEADERFMLTVGNAHGTRLLLNGRDVPLPSTRNNVVRDFVLTRNMVN